MVISDYGEESIKSMPNFIQDIGNWYHEIQSDVSMKRKTSSVSVIIEPSRRHSADISIASPIGVVAYLTIDPDQDQLRFEQNLQYDVVKTMNESKEMRVLTQKRNQAISEAKSKASRRGKRKVELSDEDVRKIETNVENELLSQPERDKLNQYRNEEDKWRALAEKHTAHRLPALGMRTRLASALAVEGTQFCLEQVSVVLDPELTDLVTRSFTDATKLLKFIPDKVANSKITVEDTARARQRNLEVGSV